MKQGGLICICLVLVSLLCVPVFAQPNTKSVETILIDNFDDPDAKDWVWDVSASRSIHVEKDSNGNVIAAKSYPQFGYAEGIPNSLRAYRTAADGTPFVLGAQVSYDRKGDNWFEVYPADRDTGAVYEIPLMGQVSQIDFWTWGANYLYYLEVIIRDAYGTVHVLPATTMNFEGWRNIIVQIPTYIRQQSKLRSGPENLTFIGFRVRADANEYADDFAIYFDQLRYTTYTMNFIYDGYELRKPNFAAQEESGK